MDLELLAVKHSIGVDIADGDVAKAKRRIERHLKKRPADGEELFKWIRATLSAFKVNEATVAAKIAEGMEAYKLVVDSQGGVHQTPDYFTQQKFVDMAAKILDMYPSQKTKLETDNGGIVIRLTPEFGVRAEE